MAMNNQALYDLANAGNELGKALFLGGPTPAERRRQELQNRLIEGQLQSQQGALQLQRLQTEQARALHPLEIARLEAATAASRNTAAVARAKAAAEAKAAADKVAISSALFSPARWTPAGPFGWTD